MRLLCGHLFEAVRCTVQASGELAANNAGTFRNTGGYKLFTIHFAQYIALKTHCLNKANEKESVNE